MSKIKKIIIFLIVGIVLLTGILLATFYLMLNKVSTIVTMDINPSIAISLNYKNDVLKVEGLNEDGKELIKDHNLKGASLKQALETVTEKVIEKGYIKENDNHILINVKGEDIKEEVVTLINKEFEEKNTTCNVITQEINETAKENAEKYGITESKASYIENLIKENTELKFEDLKDKTINEINQIVKENIKDTDKEAEQEDKEEVKEENKPSGTTGNTTNKPTTNKPTTKPVATPPASDDRTGAWCEFYKTLPPNGSMNYEMPGYINDSSIYLEESKKYLPEDSSWSSYSNGTMPYEKSAYCIAGYVELENYDKTKTYTVYMDSITLELIDLKITELPKPKIDEAGAKVIVSKWLLDKYQIDINNCGWESYYYNIGYSSKYNKKSPEWQYICKIEETKTYYTVNVDALSGELSGGRTWTN